ncbi:TIGR03503 family protein [Algibacillus agarilyticus]|uniref:TIGR03503 family protein n=1 Tax=Algibacillus agarilyticus TaxID=2234133 RepID=UPI000DCFD952|nr:TIGR03503 family protein [Algibacillus agarilyticus]
MSRLGAILITFIIFVGQTSALNAKPKLEWPGEDPTVLDAIKLLDVEGQFNGIKLLENRFRIDYAVEEATFIFFRKYGSVPVILIRPDGSKLYAATMPDSEGHWYDSDTFDMVHLTNPMIGPWQVVGKMQPNNKVMVLSDIELHADPLPALIFQGETLKLNANLTSNGKPIDYKSFSDVVALDVTFASTNNSEYENFGADTKVVGTFYDDGKGFDEYPKDGVFTGEYSFALPWGEWIPTMYLDLALFNREVTLDPIMLEPIPFEISVNQTVVNGDFHHLKISPKTDKIKFETFVFNGKAYFPNGEIELFSLGDETIEPRVKPLMNYEDGEYKVEISGFGKDINDRDVIIKAPTFIFMADPPPIPEPTAEELAQLEAERLAKQDALAAIEAQKALDAQKAKEEKALIILISVNIAALLLSILVIWFFRSGKKIKFKIPKFKLPKKKPKDELTLDGGAEKSTESDDIIDLSLPDER